MAPVRGRKIRVRLRERERERQRFLGKLDKRERDWSLVKFHKLLGRNGGREGSG